MRNPLLDFLKGVSIIAVFIIHYVSLFESTPEIQYVDILCRFAVPLFIGILGYMAAHKYRYIQDWKNFYKARFFYLFIPYLIWASIIFFIKTSEQNSNFMSDVFLGYASPPYYYMVVYFSFILIMPILVFVLKSKFKNHFITLGIIGYLILLTIIRIDTHFPYTQWFWELDFRTPIHWLGYFLIGFKLKDIQHEFRWNTTNSIVIALLTGLIILVYSPFLLVNNFYYFSYIDPQLTLLSLLTLIFFISVFNLIKKFVTSKIIGFIGKNSYGFYLSHYFFLEFCVHLKLEETFLFITALLLSILYSALHHMIENYFRNSIKTS